MKAPESPLRCRGGRKLRRATGSLAERGGEQPSPCFFHAGGRLRGRPRRPLVPAGTRPVVSVQSVRPGSCGQDDGSQNVHMASPIPCSYVEPLARGASGLETGRGLVGRSGCARRAAPRNQLRRHPQEAERVLGGVNGWTYNRAAAIAVGDASPCALLGVRIHVASSADRCDLVLGGKRITSGVQKIPAIVAIRARAKTRNAAR